MSAAMSAAMSGRLQTCLQTSFWSSNYLLPTSIWVSVDRVIMALKCQATIYLESAQTWNKVAANYGGGATLPLMTPPRHSHYPPLPIRKVPPTPKKQAVAELFCNLTCHYRWLQICLQTRLQTYQPELSNINYSWSICRRVCRRVYRQVSLKTVFFTLFSHFLNSQPTQSLLKARSYLYWEVQSLQKYISK